MKQVLYISSLLLLLGGCDLDSYMYNPDPDIDSYQLDDYEGESELVTGPEYDLDDSLITLFTLPPNEERENDLHAVYLGDIDEIDRDTVIVYCHGNAGNLDYYWHRAKLLAHVGGKSRFGVMMMDYQGYGLSKGEPTEQNLINDVNDVLQWLKDQGLSDDRLIIYGFSLGSTPATYHAANKSAMNPAWLILEAPFASQEIITQDASKLALPNEFISTEKHEVAQMINSVYQPFLWFHGIDDSYLNIETHGEVVFKNYSGKKGVANRVAGAEHGDLPLVMGYDEYTSAIEDFIFLP